MTSNKSSPPAEDTASSDIVHDDTQGGTDGNPHSGSASDNHDNSQHSETYLTPGDVDTGTVVASGQTGKDAATWRWYVEVSGSGNTTDVNLENNTNGSTVTVYSEEITGDAYFDVRISAASGTGGGTNALANYQVVKYT